MKFHFENLGSIKKAEVELGNLTVVCGKNNTGKTYLTYAVWGLLRHDMFFKAQLPEFPVPNFNKEQFTTEILAGKKIVINLSDFDEVMNGAEVNLQKQADLNRLFNVNGNLFAQSTVNVSFNEPFTFLKEWVENMRLSLNAFKMNIDFNEKSYTLEIKFNLTEEVIRRHNGGNMMDKREFVVLLLDVLKENIFRWYSHVHQEKPFIYEKVSLIPSQREGIWSFQKELDKYRSNLITDLQKNPLINIDKVSSKYSFPIQEHIDFVRNIGKLEKYMSWEYENKEIVDYIEKEILQLNYKQVEEEMMIEVGGKNIPLHVASSSVSVLLDIYLNIKYFLDKNYMLMIDEPELSLHPENQIKLARLLVKLVNAGIKVWITTHSDYIVKELNNLLVLSNQMEGKAELMAELGYVASDILQKEDARFYISYYDKELQGCTVEQITIDEWGLQKSAFDEAMVDIDRRTDKIFYAVNQQNDKHESNISQVTES